MALVSTAMAVLLAGCSEEAEAVPELPERIWWGAFASKDVLPLLPAGKEAKTYGRQFLSVGDSDSSMCALSVDGSDRFQAFAKRQDFEGYIDWSSWSKSKPESVDIGRKGIVWNGGAASYIICEPSKDSNTPGEYVELSLYARNQPSEGVESKRNRRVLRTLIGQFVDFAEKELKCG
ncbi:hypothetical protein ACFWNI_20580 [Streptomyces sp. NPDC058377]|uniref:hypothetical protein n=1 Tax=Streptomyces sp. NPDC058377 TaxID=3346468 RepID=UPI003647574B